MSKSKLLVGDLVKIIAGSYKGQNGPITSISKDKKSVSVEGLTVKKHVKPSNSDQEGGIKDIPARINISNVALQDPKQKNSTTRIGFNIVEGQKIRVAKKSKTQIKKTKKIK